MRTLIAGGLALVLGLSAQQAAAEISAKSEIERRNLAVGQAVEWRVSLEGSGMSVPEPEYRQPNWARIASQGSTQQFSITNGKASAVIIYRFLLVPEREGDFRTPVVTFRVGKTRVQTESIRVTVSPAGRPLGPSRGGSEQIWADANASPARVVVGQPIQLSIRFNQQTEVQATPMRQPEMQGFWAEQFPPPRQFYNRQRGVETKVTEWVTFLYPTVSGELTIGQTLWRCLLGERGGDPRNPFTALLGDGSRGEIVDVTTAPLTVDVVAVPSAGKPSDYDGAVGQFHLAVVPDRTEIRADETINIIVRLSGRGNLRIAPVPIWPELDDFEIYGQGSEDSLDLKGSWPSGTKRVSIALLPRRQGQLVIPPLRYSFFDPESGYHTMQSNPIPVMVSEPLAELAGMTALNPLDVPIGVLRPPRPWLGWLVMCVGLGGSFLALGWFLLYQRRQTSDGAETALREFHNQLRDASKSGDDPEYLRAAEAGLGQWQSHPDRLGLSDEERNAAQVLLNQIRKSRYSRGSQAGVVSELGPMIDRHLETLRRRMQRGRSFPLLPAALVGVTAMLAAAGAGYAVWREVSAPAGSQVMEAWSEANRYFGMGEESRARSILSALWDDGYRSGPLAAQCAVAALRDREIGTAAAWNERARRESPRDPFVRRVRLAIDEEGGLPGHPEGLGTVLTWRDSSLLAALFFALACLCWTISVLVIPRWKYAGLGFVALTILAGLVTMGLWQAGYGDSAGVAARSVPLYDSADGRPQLDLEPGRLLRLIEQHENWVHVGLGGGLRGWVPSEMIIPVDKTPPRLATTAHLSTASLDSTGASD